MRLNIRTQVGLSLICVLLLVCLSVQFIGCDEAPVGPTDEEPEELKDYVVWSWDSNEADLIMAFHPLTGEYEVYDLPFSISALTVSHDGKLLYVPSGGVVKILYTESMNQVGEIPIASEFMVMVSPDGRYVAISEDDSLMIVSTVDNEIVYCRRKPTGFVRFSADGNSLYTTDWSQGYGRPLVVSQFMTSAEETVKDYPELGSVYSLIPTPDHEKWLLMSESMFSVYDVGQDSVIFIERYQPGYGMLAMTEDGRYAFHSNPGIWISDLPAPSEITVFDIEANEIIKRIQTNHIIDVVTPSRVPIDEMAITPDDRWLIGSVVSGRGLITIDIKTLEPVSYLDLRPMSNWHRSLTVQTDK